MLRSRLMGISDPQKAMGVLSKFFKDEAYAPIKKYAINTKLSKLPLPSGFKDLREGAKKELREYIVKRWAKVNTVEDLMNLRKNVQEQFQVSIAGKVDDIISHNLTGQKGFAKAVTEGTVKTKTKAEQVLKEYFELKEPYAAFQTLKVAVGKEVEALGAVTPSILAKAGLSRSGKGPASQGLASMQDTANLGLRGMDATKLNAPDPTAFLRLAALATVAAPAAALGPAAIPISYAGAAGLVRPGTQKFLMGQLKPQRAIANILEKYAPELATAGNLGRAATTLGVVGE